MRPNLHHTEVGEGSPVILLHGLFGMGTNLGALARGLADNFRLYSLDLPNHGRSPWLEHADLPTLGEQVLQWMDATGLDSAALVGHSLGGKVAMQVALSQPGRVSRLVVADIAPVDYPGHHDRVFAALDAVSAAGCQSRSEAREIMSGMLEEPGVADFLLLSLVRGDDGCYRWRFNVEGLKANYDAVRLRPSGGGPFEGPTLFVKGELSDYIVEAHRPAIAALFSAAELKIIPGTGHWLHAEQPRLFNSVVGRFLRREG